MKLLVRTNTFAYSSNGGFTWGLGGCLTAALAFICYLDWIPFPCAVGIPINFALGNQILIEIASGTPTNPQFSFSFS
jgi:hypothetical protein